MGLEDREQLVRQIEDAVAASDVEALRAQTGGLHPADLAAVAESLEGEERRLLFDALPASLAAAALAELDDGTCDRVVEDLGEERVLRLAGGLEPKDAADLLEHLPDVSRARLVAALPERLRPEVGQRLAYPDESAGRMMTVAFPRIPAKGTVGEAVEELRRRRAGGTAIDVIFAVDEGDRLEGLIRPLDLLLARSDEAVGRYVRRDLPSIPPETDREEAAALAVEHDLAALPVVGRDERLLGIVRYDDVFDVIEQEDAEDLSFAAGTGRDVPGERTASRAIRARLPWLIVGLAGGIGSAGILSLFESALERAVSLAFFVPVLLGLAGAVAIQSSSLAVRGLATGSVAPRRLPAMAWRELRVSAGMGLALGALLAVAAFALTGRDATLASLVFVVLVLVLAIAAVGGSLIPIALQKLGLDPAVAMGPFVTTLNDVVALSIYLVVAQQLLA